MSSDNTPGRPLRVYDDQDRWRDYSTDEFVGRELNSFKGWLCAAGARNLAIKPDGRMYVATCQEGGSIGNVFGKFRIPEKWLTCSRTLCTCGADLFIPKARKTEDLERLRKTRGLMSPPEKRSEELGPLAAIERVHASSVKQVYWEITHRCNYDCSYCLPILHNKKDAFRTLSEIAAATERLCEEFARGEKMNFIISGGEPTLQPYFVDWVRLVNLLGHHVSSHSNGSNKAEVYRKLIHHSDLNLSLHFEFWRPERFFEVVAGIVEEKRTSQEPTGHLEVKVMMSPGRYEETMEVERRLRSIEGFTELCTWAVVPVRVGEFLDDVDPRYEPRERELFGDRV